MGTQRRIRSTFLTFPARKHRYIPAVWIEIRVVCVQLCLCLAELKLVHMKLVGKRHQNQFSKRLCRGVNYKHSTVFHIICHFRPVLFAKFLVPCKTHFAWFLGLTCQSRSAPLVAVLTSVKLSDSLQLQFSPQRQTVSHRKFYKIYTYKFLVFYRKEL